MGIVVVERAARLNPIEYRLSEIAPSSDAADASAAIAAALVQGAGSRIIFDKESSSRSRYVVGARTSFSVASGTRLEFEVPVDFSGLGPPTTTDERKTYFSSAGSTGTEVALAGDIARGEDVISLGSGVVAAQGYAVGDWLILKSTAKFPRGYAQGYSAEQVLIKAIAGDDIQVGWPVNDDYDVADSAVVAKITHTENVKFINPQLIGTGRPASVAGDSGLQFNWAMGCGVEGGKLVDVDYNGIRILNGINCRVDGTTIIMPQPGANTNVQYGASVIDSAQDCTVNGCAIYNGKHAIAGSVSVGGVQRRLLISNNRIYNTWSSCSAVHENAEHADWIGNHAIGCNSGFDVRCGYARLEGNTVRFLYEGNEGIGIELSRRTYELTALNNIIEGGRYAIRLGGSTDYQLAYSDGPAKIKIQGGRFAGQNTRGMELSLDLLSNGQITSDFAWTKDSSWTFESTVVGSTLATGYRHSTGTTTLSQAVTFVDGETYRVLFNIFGRTAGSVAVRFSGGTPVTGTSRSTDAQYTEDLTVNGNTGFEFVPTADFDGIIDRVAIYRLDGGSIVHYDLEISGVTTDEQAASSVLINGPFARGKITGNAFNGEFGEASPSACVVTYNAQDFIVANNTYADAAAPVLGGTNMRQFNNYDVTDTAALWASIDPSADVLEFVGAADYAEMLSLIGAQAASANLDEYAAVNPSAAALAILDDASNGAIMTTLGISANGQSLITATNYAAMVALLRPVTNQSSSFSVPTSGVGVTYTNTSATALVVASLPAATTERRYSFLVTDTDGIKILANGSDTIRLGGTVSAGGGYAQSTTIGDTVELLAIATGVWVATTYNGTWTVT